MKLNDIIKNELKLNIRHLTTTEYEDEFIDKIVADYVYGIDWDNKYLAHKGLSVVAVWIVKKHKLR